MIKSDEYQFVFVHVRKTGGSSITAALGPILGYKVPARDVFGWQPKVHNYGEMHAPFRWDQSIADYFTFGFVRNPFDILVSLYANWRLGRPGRPQPRRTQQVGSFSAFVKAFFIEDVFQKWRTEGQQYLLTCQKTGRVVDFIGRFDQLQRDWDRICLYLGLSRIVLPKRNQMAHAIYHTMYSPNTRSLVETLWASELAFARYDWGGPVGGPAQLPGHRVGETPGTALRRA